MDINNKIIAIAGNARSGKDTLGKYISEILIENGIKNHSKSFAFALKNEVDEFLLKTIGISAFTEDPAEKTLIRKFLVFWGSDFRRSINPDIWINKLVESTEKDSVLIITDLRFENELKWVRDNNGIVLYLSRISESGEIIPPANDYEKYNNKIILDDSDNSLTWMTSNDSFLLKSLAREILDSTISKDTLDLWKATCH
jgi:hypothetical protein